MDAHEMKNISWSNEQIEWMYAMGYGKELYTDGTHITEYPYTLGEDFKKVFIDGYMTIEKYVEKKCYEEHKEYIEDCIKDSWTYIDIDNDLIKGVLYYIKTYGNPSKWFIGENGYIQNIIGANTAYEEYCTLADEDEDEEAATFEEYMKESGCTLIEGYN